MSAPPICLRVSYGVLELEIGVMYNGGDWSDAWDRVGVLCIFGYEREIMDGAGDVHTHLVLFVTPPQWNPILV